VDEVAASIERNLTIVGSTAIEDLLQEDVADTIVSLREAGIKIWVLTGDKVGTAMNVGVTCGLLDSTMKEFVIREGAKKDIKETLGQHFRESKMINKS
jgi:P-type E1-E2 ATPase